MSKLDKLSNNIYGVLISQSSLEKLGQVIRDTLGLTQSEVCVYKSHYNKNEFLKICTNSYHLKTIKTEESSEYLFNGEVMAGDRKVFASIKKIADALNDNNCFCTFEIYNDNLECIYEYPLINKEQVFF